MMTVVPLTVTNSSDVPTPTVPPKTALPVTFRPSWPAVVPAMVSPKVTFVPVSTVSTLRVTAPL